MCRKNRNKLDNVYCLVVGCLERIRDNWREYRDDASSVIQVCDKISSFYHKSHNVLIIISNVLKNFFDNLYIQLFQLLHRLLSLNDLYISTLILGK